MLAASIGLGGAPGTARAAAVPQAQRGVPLAQLVRQADTTGHGSYSVQVWFRTIRAIPLNRSGNARGGVTVNDEQSLDATSQIGLISRHCYVDGPLESHETKLGDHVRVALFSGSSGVAVDEKTVTVRPASRKRINDIGCGGRKRAK